MKIAFLTPSVSRAIGGIFEIERRLGQTLASLPGVEVSVYALQDKHTIADLGQWQPLVPKSYPVAGPPAFGFSAQLIKAFMQENADIAHLHSLWMFTSVVMHRWGKMKRRPYIVTPNGMLEPWALRNSLWKKRMAGLLYERNMLNGAACIQANTEKEATDVRAYGFNGPVCIIPNGVDLAGFGNPPARAWLEDRFPALKQRRWVLFLSRIHPKKGLPHLLRAWAAIQKAEGGKRKAEDWVLVIAGPDELGHEAEVKSLATGLGLAWTEGRGQKSADENISSAVGPPPSVVFTGPLHGDEKRAALGGSELFVLPSFSEGFSMAILEAAAAGLPVMMTRQCNFPELAKAGGAVEVAPDAAGCEAGLRQLLALPDPDRQAMGQRGKNLVGRSYTWSRIADQMAGVYRWLLEGGSPPPCVRLN